MRTMVMMKSWMPLVLMCLMLKAVGLQDKYSNWRSSPTHWRQASTPNPFLASDSMTGASQSWQVEETRITNTVWMARVFKAKMFLKI